MRLRLAQELLDDDLGTPEEIQRSFADLGWINRRLGGWSSWRKLLGNAADRMGTKTVTVLDVGAGTGEVLRLIADELRARGLSVTALALDRRATHLGAAPERVVGDALALPFADASCDLVVCNLFFHHFHGEAATRLLRELGRVARRAVIVNDLERGWLPWLFIQALAPRFGRITRHDGPRSVAQAYTAGELGALARTALGGSVDVARLWPYRLGLTVWRQR